MGFILDPLVEDNQRYVFYEAANPHSMPVSVSSFGLQYKKSEWGVLFIKPQQGYQFPFAVGPGKSLRQSTTLHALYKELRESCRRPQDLKDVWFRSETDKTFTGRISKAWRKELEREFTEGIQPEEGEAG